MSAIQPHHQIKFSFVFKHNPSRFSCKSSAYYCIHIFYVHSITGNPASVVLDSDLWKSGCAFYLRIRCAFNRLNNTCYSGSQCCQSINVLSKDFYGHILPHAESEHGMFGMVTALIVDGPTPRV